MTRSRPQRLCVCVCVCVCVWVWVCVVHIYTHGYIGASDLETDEEPTPKMVEEVATLATIFRHFRDYSKHLKLDNPRQLAEHVLRSHKYTCVCVSASLPPPPSLLPLCVWVCVCVCVCVCKCVCVLVCVCQCVYYLVNVLGHRLERIWQR